MLDNFKYNFVKNSTVAVAVSGGSDSMALLHFLWTNSKAFNIKVVAINVEHGIRGKSSISDSAFVKNYCKEKSIPLLSYSVDSLGYAKNNKLSIEQSARKLRYDCFFDCISSKKCDYIATAHHLSDNAETVLLNLFRGTGLKGVTGIGDGYGGKIIRPFINISKAQITEYIEKNNIPFVVDESNLKDEYTRNFIRHNVMPRIKEIFPNVEQSIYNFCTLAKEDQQFLDNLAKSYIIKDSGKIKIPDNLDKAIFSRAVIFALKEMGITKDWEKVHVEDIYSLTANENGSKISLPKNVCAIKEYDNIVFYCEKAVQTLKIPFSACDFEYDNKTYQIQKVSDTLTTEQIKAGFYADYDKIPKSAEIRTKQDGDIFTKFGGGTKTLSDFFTDKKIPLRIRNSIPLIASGNDVLYIFNVAISDKIRIDGNTVNIIKFITKEKDDGQF